MEAGESLPVPEPVSAPPAVADLEDKEDEAWEIIERPEGASKRLDEQYGHQRQR